MRRSAHPLVVVDVVVVCLCVAMRETVLEALATAVAFRAAVVVHSLLNEWGHVLVGLCLGARQRALNAANLTGHRPLRVHVAALLPFLPDLRGDLTVRIAGLSRREANTIRKGGFCVSSLLSVVMVTAGLVLSEDTPVWHGMWAAHAVGTALALTAAWLTDMTAMAPYAATLDVMACGNVTLVGRLLEGEDSAFPKRGRTILEAMLRVSQMRGAQSGGGAVLISGRDEPRQMIRKCVNTKRGDLAALMTAGLASTAGRKAPFGASFVVQTHVRYATAGLTMKHEAHPFRFVELAERGPRRITQLFEGSPSVSARPVETALTHNGDMDGLRFRGIHLAFPDLGLFLERVLGVPNRWVGDSPLLAAAIELFLTKGMWLESLRLAYHLVVAPPPPDFTAISPDLQGRRRVDAVRKLAAAHPAPSLAELRRWEALAERVLADNGGEAPGDPDNGRAMRTYRELLAQRLAERFDDAAFPEIGRERSHAFARAAVNAFFDNDLYIALRKLEPGLDGTFGCVVTSTLEPGVVVALSRGQPLSLGFQRSSGTVSIASERSALKVRGPDGVLAFDERLDLDLCRGEIARVEVTGEGPIQLTLYGISEGREYKTEELQTAGRMVPLADNPYVSPLPADASDRVDADIAAIVPISRSIRKEWQASGSHNASTAEAFAEALFRRARPRLLLIGITSDLWLSEQFARNLKTLFPGVEACALSSNTVLKDEATAPLDENTVVLAVSQSGQDFPTLGALILLQQRLSSLSDDGFFVLTGEIDSLMGQAVGQLYARGARFSSRIFSNLSGFRPSEAPMATVNATHHTFVELLLFLTNRAMSRPDPPLGFALDDPELRALGARRDLTVDRQAPSITGTLPDESDAPVEKQLGRLSRRWTWHVIEGIAAFALVVLVLELNLQFRLGLLPSRLLALLPSPELTPVAWLAPLAATLGSQADVVFYAFLGPLLVWTLRKAQGRPVFHRQGTRELLIGDTGYVHRIIWLLARKLFSLSYGFASIKVYSADCQDELVMTHEPLRGTLALVGLPDARRSHLRTRAAAAFMAAKQFNYSRSFAGMGAEIVTIGHTPAARDSTVGTHLALPDTLAQSSSPQVDVLMEDMFDSWERLMAMQVFLDRMARGVSRFAVFRYDRSRTKDQVFAPTTAAPVSAAAIYQLLSRTSERYESFQQSSLPFDVIRSEWRGSAPPVRTTVWRSSYPPDDAKSPPAAAPHAAPSPDVDAVDSPTTRRQFSE